MGAGAVPSLDRQCAEFRRPLAAIAPALGHRLSMGQTGSRHLKILQSTPSLPQYIAPPKLAVDQVVCGPQYPNMSSGGRIVSLKTSSGQYDIAAVYAALPAAQRPDLFIARVDSSGLNSPRNVAALPCRKILLVGDTHHMKRPIASLVSYALAERYDAVILDYTRQHAHFFAQAGIPSVHWLPGVNVARIPVPGVAKPAREFAFVGHAGKFHSRRRALCGLLVGQGLPLEILRAYGRNARILHSTTRTNLNCSLNGDLNLRVFEVLASGGFLLTDKLSPEAGLDMLFDDGRHLVTYADALDCVAQARTLLADPARTAAIAAAGRRHYEAYYSTEAMHAQLLALADGKATRPEFAISRDPRATQPCVPASVLFARIQVYESLQDFKAEREHAYALVDPAVDPAIVSDAIDLPRFRIMVAGEAGHHRRHLERLGLNGRVTFDANPDANAWNIVLTTVAGWRSGFAEAAMRRNPNCHLLLTDQIEDQFLRHDLTSRRYAATKNGPNIYASSQQDDLRPYLPSSRNTPHRA